MELASASAYGKGIVNAALEPLAMAGIIEIQVSGNQFRHRLARAEQLAKLVAPLPLRFPDWHSRFRVIYEVVLFAEMAPPTGMPRAVEARRTIRTLDPYTVSESSVVCRPLMERRLPANSNGGPSTSWATGPMIATRTINYSHAESVAC